MVINQTWFPPSGEFCFGYMWRSFPGRGPTLRARHSELDSWNAFSWFKAAHLSGDLPCAICALCAKYKYVCNMCQCARQLVCVSFAFLHLATSFCVGHVSEYWIIFNWRKSFQGLNNSFKWRHSKMLVLVEVLKGHILEHERVTITLTSPHYIRTVQQND